MHMYGCELWDLNWAHNAIIDNLSYNIDLQFDTRTMKFVHLCLNHCIRVCNSLLSAKPHCTKSRFAANYKHLSYKYKICQDDWFIDINLLIAKINAHFEKEAQNISTAHTIVELMVWHFFKEWILLNKKNQQKRKDIVIYCFVRKL